MNQENESDETEELEDDPFPPDLRKLIEDYKAEPFTTDESQSLQRKVRQAIVRENERRRNSLFNRTCDWLCRLLWGSDE